MPEGQGLDNSVSSQLAGNDVASLYGVINRDNLRLEFICTGRCESDNQTLE
ncbi:hypothetical protein PILCRDRAFT_584199 [Piloderma croceum F 1598]|uniref:Uncharacterized protein n=1 Tax=Piloderma croceum (strain F 1598) TaxID=765440 RepID=A0A0C3FG44_PILCF|nr:hypothetical protein PILCRDRAFT_584199 [Piloderma croceum F 1598]